MKFSKKLILFFLDVFSANSNSHRLQSMVLVLLCGSRNRSSRFELFAVSSANELIFLIFLQRASIFHGEFMLNFGCWAELCLILDFCIWVHHLIGGFRGVAGRWLPFEIASALPPTLEDISLAQPANLFSLN